MACYFTDNVHTRTFTPREYQVELLDAAKERNLIVCLGTQANKIFLTIKLIQELSESIRRPWSSGAKRTLFVGEGDSIQFIAQVLRHLTDFSVGEYYSLTDSFNFKQHQIIFLTSEVLDHWVTSGKIKWQRINLLIVDDCHNALRQHPIRKVVLDIRPYKTMRVVGLTSHLFTCNATQPGSVIAQIKYLEKDLNATVDTANEVISVLRYSAHPTEILVVFNSPSPTELTETINAQVSELLEFLDDHRYDPSEIYEEDFQDEIKDIPDPKRDPYNLIEDFLYILRTMGPWGADKAALLLLIHVEKLKVKTPYERHFLLLCLLSSVLLKIRAICDDAFQGLSESEKIYKYSSPKILRLVEIVRQFKPNYPPNMLKEHKVDSGNTIQDSSQEQTSEENKNSEPNSNNEVVLNKNDNESTVEEMPEEKSETKNDALPLDEQKITCNGEVQISENETTAEENEIHQNGCQENESNEVHLSSKPTQENDVHSNDCSSFKSHKSNTYPTELNQSESSTNESTLCNGDQDPGDTLVNGSASSDADDTPVFITNGLKDLHLSNAHSNSFFILQMTGSNEHISNSHPHEPELLVSTNGHSSEPKHSHSPLLKSGHSKVSPEDGGHPRPFHPKWRGRGRGWRHNRKTQDPSSDSTKPHRPGYIDDADNLCGIIFVNNRFTAKVLFHLLNDLRKCDPDFTNILSQYTVEKIADPSSDSREAELEHKKQEDVLKRFRMRECNIVVATSILEEGIELPRCNVVIRFDPENDYTSHAKSKARARQNVSYYVVLIEKEQVDSYLNEYAKYMTIEQNLLSRCANEEPTYEEEYIANSYIHGIPPYKPVPEENEPNVNMSNAIALVNRYCAKLPSDTFTRLSPTWSLNEITYSGQRMYYCKIRLPINSTFKREIIGHPMPTKVLARQIAAMETCRVLHTNGELDDQLEPIGKEAFNCFLDEEDLSPLHWDPNIPRPGTTKSRQYYYKRIAGCLNDCRPVPGVQCHLYNIDLVLTCPLPEEQNTRGRKLHPPELAPQAFAILTLKKIPKICPFPIFTRSGEVQVSLRLCSSSIVLSEEKVTKIAAFLNYILSSVLRLQKYLMCFDSEARENSFFIVPTKKDESGCVQVDWEFLDLIYERRGESPQNIPEEERQTFSFDPDKYADAVVMPWYRNQDQPQYFYVAEICNHLNPNSSFPGCDYVSFEDYYFKKYGLKIQNSAQPLLDVDHTSARLNFLTPRYVNRKGVALPTSSEETKRAKRENLEQKQILIPELCLVHIVPASLWRQAVCLPCILYRINALLLADEIRTTVAHEVGLGVKELPEGFEWPPLDFGWSLADVLNKSKIEKEKLKSIEPDKSQNEVKENQEITEEKPEDSTEPKTETEEEKESKENEKEDGDEDKDEEEDPEKEKEGKDKDEGWIEIGTWSNDMAKLGADFHNGLPDDLTMVRYGSPTSWEPGKSSMYNYYCSDPDSDDSDYEEMMSDDSESSSNGGTFKITFKGDNLAEAEDDDAPVYEEFDYKIDWDWNSSDTIPELQEDISKEISLFEENTEANKKNIMVRKMLVSCEDKFIVDRSASRRGIIENGNKRDLPFEFTGYCMPPGVLTESDISEEESVTSECSDSETSIEEPDDGEPGFEFSFDEQPVLEGHPGPSPSLLLQGLTMSNANDGINLERLETIGDSFLKYAITTYLYCTYENIHEGKLSHLRSKQVSNLNLYRLGRKKVLGESMIASKFEPHDNWLPPCYLVPRDAEQALLDEAEPSTLLPYNLVTQHSIPDKSIADCVEALIGAYLISCGPRGALIFMSWLGIKVLPWKEVPVKTGFRPKKRIVGSTIPDNGIQIRYGELNAPKSPLLRYVANPEGELERLLKGFEILERKLHYGFNDRAYLLQAMTHASYFPNRLTDCYQRLEFLGDAVLDYLITRHLYEDKRAHSPGALTDLRSALVNNTIFASLAVRHGLHKYFRHLSPGLAEVIQRFVTIQEENSHTISEEYYLVGEEAEDIEVPKALGDVFESIAGAIFLDSYMSLDTVWAVYYRMMKKEIEQFSAKVPKSPIRELLELEPETAKFGKPEKLADGRRVRVTVEVFGKGTYKGIGRNYRIAKCTAAKCALKQLKKKGLLARKLSYINPPADWNHV